VEILDAPTLRTRGELTASEEALRFGWASALFLIVQVRLDFQGFRLTRWFAIGDVVHLVRTLPRQSLESRTVTAQFPAPPKTSPANRLYTRV
jgi:hypothetical protein